MRSTNRKTFSCLNLTACSILLAAQAISPATSFAADGDQSLGGSNSTNSLPESNFGGGVLRYRSPLNEAIAPEGSANEPLSTQMGGSDPSYSPFPSAPTQAGTVGNATDIRNSNAWYKFLGPSLNLSRALTESERKHLLSIVPMPLDIRSGNRRKSDIHVVLLRADNNADYACFKTICGSLFARSGALLLVCSSGSVVRMLNLNGREKDVLFKLPNEQVITIGPGSEMIVSKALHPHDLSSADGIARRGLTRTMKCSEMQMAFSQFSHASVFELPELKFFKNSQSPRYIQTLMDTVSQLDAIRGTTGFKQVVAAAEQSAQRDHQAHSAANNVVVKLVPVQKPADARAARAVDVKAAPRVEDQAKLDKEREKKIALNSKDRKPKRQEPANAFRQADKTAPPSKELETKDTLANHASKTVEKSKSVDKRLISLGGKIKGSFSRTGSVEATTMTHVENPASNDLASSSAPRVLLPKRMPGPDTPPEIARLMLESNSKEKEAAALRKKADKCTAFVSGGLLNNEQQLRMKVEAQQDLKLAREAEDKSQALRRQVEIAESSKGSAR